MDCRTLPALVLAAGLLVPVVEAQHGIPDVPTFAGVTNRAIPALMHRYGVAGVSIAVLQQGEVGWSATWGEARPDEPLGPGAIFRVESISKPVTAWGVLRLAERGAIDLDTRVADLLETWSFPPSDFATSDITVRQLLTHTAGLPIGGFAARFRPGEPVTALRDNLTAEARLERGPGLRFSYSNTGFNLLELVIEEVSGERFADFMAREVLTPLGMNEAGFDWRADMARRIPDGHDLRGAPVPFYAYPGRASGGLLATVSDVAQFARAGMAPAFRPVSGVLGEAAMEALYTRQVATAGPLSLVADGYGLGFFVDTLPDGSATVWHGGQGYGWMSHLQLIPARGDGIVILANSQRAWPLFAHILREWSVWNGIPPVGMSRIARIIPLVWTVVAISGFMAAAALLRLAFGISSADRTFAPLARQDRGRRLLCAASSGLLIGILLWAAVQDYLFLESVAPHAVTPLWIALASLALALALAAVLPRARRDPGGTRVRM